MDVRNRILLQSVRIPNSMAIRNRKSTTYFKRCFQCQPMMCPLEIITNKDASVPYLMQSCFNRDVYDFCDILTQLLMSVVSVLTPYFYRNWQINKKNFLSNRSFSSAYLRTPGKVAERTGKVHIQKLIYLFNYKVKQTSFSAQINQQLSISAFVTYSV